MTFVKNKLETLRTHFEINEELEEYLIEKYDRPWHHPKLQDPELEKLLIEDISIYHSGKMNIEALRIKAEYDALMADYKLLRQEYDEMLEKRRHAMKFIRDAGLLHLYPFDEIK